MYRKSSRFSIALFLAVLSLALMLPNVTVHADMGFGGYMWFTFEYPNEPILILEGKMLECSDATCSTSETTICGGYGGFGCESGKCYAKVSGPNCRAYHKLVITFADKTRESNVFTRAMSGNYVVTVKEDSLSVREIQSPLGAAVGFCIALPSTLLIELVVAAIYLTVTKLQAGRGRVVALLFLANIISLPVVWFVFPLLRLSFAIMTILSELFAVAFEAFFLFSTLKEDGMSLKHATMLSFLMNAASFLIGLLLSTALSMGG